MRPHEIRRPEDASELVAARRAAKVSQVRAASILGTSEKYISMLERGQRELKPIRRASCVRTFSKPSPTPAGQPTNATGS